MLCFPQANSAEQEGGALGTQGWDGAVLAVTGSTLANNTAAQGGALQCNAGTALSLQARASQHLCIYLHQTFQKLHLP